MVLINGKRRHQSALVNVNGTINRGQVSTDLSAIPATAIERIEILRDGASAQYGSDAIAGVINIVLKKKTGFLEAGASYGAYVTEYQKNYALYKIQNKTDDPNVKVTDGNTFQGSLGYGFNYKEHTIITMPLPSSGGIILEQMMKMAEKRNLPAMKFESAQSVQLMTDRAQSLCRQGTVFRRSRFCKSAGKNFGER